MTEFYLYETIHVRRGAPRLVAEHVAALDTASQALFGREYRPDVRRLEERIAALIRAERYPDGVSGFVRLELSAGGERLVAAGPSFYDGYALRTLTPDAATVEYCLPPLAVGSSAREATTALADRHAGSAGAAIAVRSDRDGVLTEADSAPLFAVRKRELLTSPGAHTAVQSLVLRAAAHLTITEAPILRDELASYDELFYADHRGVTALAHCDGHPYTSLAAERVAAAMERLFR